MRSRNRYLIAEIYIEFLLLNVCASFWKGKKETRQGWKYLCLSITSEFYYREEIDYYGSQYNKRMRKVMSISLGMYYTLVIYIRML